jgi:hypothetical protein
MLFCRAGNGEQGQWFFACPINFTIRNGMRGPAAAHCIVIDKDRSDLTLLNARGE